MALRVAIFTDTYVPQMNGVARTIARLTRELRSRRHEARVWTPSDERMSPDPDVVECGSRPFSRYPDLRVATPRWSRIVSELEAWNPDIVHVATPFGVGLAGRHAARKLGIPLVTSYHTHLVAYARHYRMPIAATVGWTYLRWFHNAGLATYCPTRAVMDEIGARGLRRLSIWGRGVDCERFNPRMRNAALRRSWGADDRSVVITYVGRLAHEKGIDVVLSALSLVGRERSRVIPVIVGDGPYEMTARRLAPRGTIFAGRLEGEALSAAYASSDLFVFPSTTDTFGNVILEAMASGVPVIGANVPSTRELLANGGGVLFRPSRAENLAANLIGLVDSPARRQALASVALEQARARTWDSVFDALFADYSRLALLRRSGKGH